MSRFVFARATPENVDCGLWVGLLSTILYIYVCDNARDAENFSLCVCEDSPESYVHISYFYVLCFNSIVMLLVHMQLLLIFVLLLKINVVCRVT